ncbi:MAG: prenyltransferase/squalene oxidase repeat-containing protein [Polyangiaceae bacterium]
MSIDLLPSLEEPPISTQSGDDEPPPSIAPKSNGTSWWFKRQPSRDTLPPPPSVPVEQERSYAEQVERSLERAVRYAISMQDERGAWSIEPDPRLFDTAFVAYVLSHVEVAAAAAAVERAYPWIEKHQPQNHDPVALLLDATPRRLLIGDFSPVDLRGPTLYSNLYRRKTLLLYTLGLHAGVRVLSPYVASQLKDQVKRFYERVDQIRTKQWNKVDLIAVYAILEALEGNRAVASTVCERLAKLQAPDGGFCYNPLSTAIAFLALSVGMSGSEPWQRCLTYLLEGQRADGTWRFCTCDVWDTTVMLRAYGDHPMFARAAAPRGLAFLREMQNEDGGWGFRPDVESDNDTASSALLALRDHEDDHTLLAAERGIAYLLGLQRDDGLWNTWQAAEDHPVEDCVAHITAAIAAFRGTHTRSIRAAQRWLEQQYQQHGRWTAGWYRNLPYSTLEVSKGLRAGHPIAYSAVRQLLVLQNQDGGFPPEPGEPSSASATGLAVAALAEHYDVHQPALRRALELLLSKQTEEGTWLGEPEMYGPRPLTTHYQTTTHGFVGFGLMAAWRRIVKDR